ncbi:hypothetical protein RND81_07G042300 [Saponaria officinalis]|uniref:PI4-kinase N-terminal domain-containing protein n=1 Tax=Saponaria officinalis TaxID=3572 RepID=A0AAW1JRG2_SAPOF
MIDAAESCLLSVWRKMRICEELFSCLLSVVSQVAIAHGGQLLRVLLFRLKPLVLTACAQADTWVAARVPCLRVYTGTKMQLNYRQHKCLVRKITMIEDNLEKSISGSTMVVEDMDLVRELLAKYCMEHL